VVVKIVAPDEATDGGNFSAEINISYVGNFDAANYDIAYNASVIQVTGVRDGSINGAPIPVDDWGFIPEGEQGVVRIINNVAGAPGVNGSGNLSWIDFDVVGNVCDSSGLVFNVSVSVLYDNLAQEISATWLNDSVHVVE